MRMAIATKKLGRKRVAALCIAAVTLSFSLVLRNDIAKSVQRFSRDSVAYLSCARNIHAGRGIGLSFARGLPEGFPVPKTDQPPGYGICVALLLSGGFPPDAAALAVPAFACACTLLGLSTLGYTRGGLMGCFLASVLSATFWPVMWASVHAWSEPLFALVLVFTGILLTVGVELFYVLDLYGNRMNTVFKLYYQAWAMLAVASAFGVYRLGSTWRGGRGWRRGLRALWWLALALLVAGCSLYPVASVHTKTQGFSARPTLDGLAFLEAIAPGERRAIDWLNSNVEGTPVILEAVGPDFTEFGRVSAHTGLPTLVGWTAHEWQWRGTRLDIDERARDVELIYRSQDMAQVEALLQRYKVRYVYVGRFERASYGEAFDFSAFMDVVYKDAGVTIYRVRGGQ